MVVMLLLLRQELLLSVVVVVVVALAVVPVRCGPLRYPSLMATQTLLTI